MKLQKNTLFLILLAFILSGSVYLYEMGQRSTIESTQKERQLFNLTEENIVKLTVERSELTLKFIRSKKDSDSWQMTAPQDAVAEDGRISFLLDLAVNNIKERDFNISDRQLGQYGLERPKGKIILETKDRQTYQIILGKKAIAPNTIYARIITPQTTSSEIQVVVVSQNWQYGIEQELAEWTKES